MYISTQFLGGNMLEFFNHETLQYLPPFAKGSEMRSGTKSDLVKCILTDFTTSTINAQPKANGAVSKGSVLVNLIKPKKNQSFKYYSSEVFCPHIRKQQDLYVADRVDVVFDTYKEQSLKTTTRLKRRKSIRRKVQQNSVVPMNWKGFLRLDQNKAELFHFLSKTVISYDMED